MFRTFAIASAALLDEGERKKWNSRLTEFEMQVKAAKDASGQDRWSCAVGQMFAASPGDTLTITFYVVKNVRQFGQGLPPYIAESIDEAEFEAIVAGNARAPSGGGTVRRLQ